MILYCVTLDPLFKCLFENKNTSSIKWMNFILTTMTWLLTGVTVQLSLESYKFLNFWPNLYTQTMLANSNKKQAGRINKHTWRKVKRSSTRPNKPKQNYDYHTEQNPSFNHCLFSTLKQSLMWYVWLESKKHNFVIFNMKHVQ